MRPPDPLLPCLWRLLLDQAEVLHHLVGAVAGAVDVGEALLKHAPDAPWEKKSAFIIMRILIW